ncbi:MAG TPA: hypothetical protein VIZ43_16965 [Trebonia sp.]
MSDAAFAGLNGAALKAALPTEDPVAAVMFVADATTLSADDHPILVVDLLPEDREPFRCIPSELWSIDNNLNIANMDWEDFADAVDEGGVFRGFDE